MTKLEKRKLKSQLSVHILHQMHCPLILSCASAPCALHTIKCKYRFEYGFVNMYNITYENYFNMCVHLLRKQSPRANDTYCVFLFATVLSWDE